MFTFETRYLGSDWLRSGREFETARDAGYAIVDWLVTSFENGLFPEVRLVELPK
jgi:hypothetical protein